MLYVICNIYVFHVGRLLALSAITAISIKARQMIFFRNTFIGYSIISPFILTFFNVSPSTGRLLKGFSLP